MAEIVIDVLQPSLEPFGIGLHLVCDFEPLIFVI